MVASYYCTVVNGQKGCCKNGKICTSGGGGGGSECATSGYVLCPGENFCCRMSRSPLPPHPPLRPLTHTVFFLIIEPGYTSYRDSANNPKCGLYSTNTITRTSTIRTPTLTSTSPWPTSTPGGGNGDTSDDSDGSNDNSNTGGSNSNGLTSYGLPSSGYNSTTSSSTRSSSSSTRSSATPPPSPSGPPSALSGAKNCKGSLTFFVLAPFLVLMGVWML